MQQAQFKQQPDMQNAILKSQQVLQQEQIKQQIEDRQFQKDQLEILKESLNKSKRNHFIGVKPML